MTYGDAGTDAEVLRKTLVEFEFCRLISGRMTSIEGRLELCTDWSRGAATPETEVAVVAASRMLRALRAERLEDDRWRRAEVGMIVVEVVYEYGSDNSSEAEDAVEATEAV